MKKLLVCIAFLAMNVMIPTVVSAQTAVDVVYLKNGSIIKGTVIELVLNESVKIETRDGSIFVYRMEEVQKMTKEVQKMTVEAEKMTMDAEESYSQVEQSPFNKRRGYLGIVEFGLGYGVGSWAADRFSVSMINGYRVAPQFAVGVGVGLETFTYNNAGTESTDITLPVFAHLRSDFIEGKVSPYIALNAGYELNIGGDYFGGTVLEPVLGVGWNVGRKSRMTAGFSYILNQVNYTYTNGYWTSNVQTGWGSAIKLKIGFSW